jgi:hypothetical protein
MGSVEKAAKRYGATIEARHGHAEFVGTEKQDGTDREQRDDARRVYEGVIQRSGVPGSSAIWQKLHHRWATALAHDALLEDAARKTPQAQHPRIGRFAKAHVVAREKAARWRWTLKTSSSKPLRDAALRTRASAMGLDSSVFYYGPSIRADLGGKGAGHALDQARDSVRRLGRGPGEGRVPLGRLPRQPRG